MLDENHIILNGQQPYVIPKLANIKKVSSRGTVFRVSSGSNVDDSVSTPIIDKTLENEVSKSVKADNPTFTINSVHSSDTSVNLGTNNRNVIKCRPSSLYITKDKTDKWPVDVESAFIASLRLVPKKGTSKIKLSHKNYGRNELISLYIYYHTKNFRSKKQISSHIQVLKKAIISKKENNLEITDSELQLYDLIENGAPITDKSRENFEEEFSVVIEGLEKEVLRDPKRLLCKSFPMLNSSARRKKYLFNGKHEKQNHVFTPSSTRNNMNSDFKNEKNQELLKDNSVPIYPVKYAKNLYENLPDYTCFPVNIENNDVYCLYPIEINDDNNNNDNKKIANDELKDDIFGKKPMNRNDALLEASEIETQQSDLINNKFSQNQQIIEGVINTTESSTTDSNNSSQNDGKNYISQKHNSTSISFKNDTISTNSSIDNHEISSLSPNSYLNLTSQWNTLFQRFLVSKNSKTNKVKMGADNLSKQSQLSVREDPDLLQTQTQFYPTNQKNRLYPTFTPVNSKFPSNYPQTHWFSPNKQLAISQFNFIPSQYTQKSDLTDYQSRNQPFTRQPPSNHGPYRQYYSQHFKSNIPQNTSQVYPNSILNL